MTETVIGYNPNYTKSDVDALRADDKATIARQQKDIIAGAGERDRAEAEIKRLQVREVEREKVLRLTQKRLEMIGVIVDKELHFSRREWQDSLDVILTAQVLPPQCDHCGAPLDPERKDCPVCYTDIGKAEQQAHKDHLAGV